jgi:hypothetical protein
MVKPKTFIVTLRGTEITDFGFRLRIDLTGKLPGPTKFETTITTPDELDAAIDAIVAAADRPEGTETFPVNGFYISVDPKAGRWPAGFKARFDKSLTRRFETIAA